METYQLIAPSPPLAPFIAYYWILQSEAKEKMEERIFPTGYMQLIFYRSGKPFSKTTNQWQPRAFIGGQTNTYNDLTMSGSMQVIAVAFRPHGLKAFFKFSMEELHNLTVPLDSLQDPQIKELQERVMESQDEIECISWIESYLIKRLTFSSAFNYNRINKILYAANTIPEVTIEKLSEIGCLSKKQFTRIFAEYTGSNPKDFLRILRFQRVLYILQQNPNIPLSELAFQTCYYDQPHFTKEFKTFTGYTPAQYRDLYIAYSDYFYEPVLPHLK